MGHFPHSEGILWTTYTVGYKPRPDAGPPALFARALSSLAQDAFVFERGPG